MKAGEFYRCVVGAELAPYLRKIVAEAGGEVFEEERYGFGAVWRVTKA